MKSNFKKIDMKFDKVFKMLRNIKYINYDYLRTIPFIQTMSEFGFIKDFVTRIPINYGYNIVFFYRNAHSNVYENEKFKIDSPENVQSIHNFLDFKKEYLITVNFTFYVYNRNFIDFNIIDSNQDLDLFLNKNQKNSLHLTNTIDTLPIPETYKNITSLKHEHLLINKLIQKIPNAFDENFKSLDILAKMHSNEAPTRLIEVYKTNYQALSHIYNIKHKNPKHKTFEIITFNYEHNKIKDEDSDTVAILSTIPTLTLNEQITLARLVDFYNMQCKDENKVKKFNELPITKKFIGEIEKRVSRFNYIQVPETIFKDIIVSPKRNIEINHYTNSNFILLGLSKGIFTYEFYNSSFLNSLARNLNSKNDVTESNIDQYTINLSMLEKMEKILMPSKSSKMTLTFISPGYYNYNFLKKWEDYQVE